MRLLVTALLALLCGSWSSATRTPMFVPLPPAWVSSTPPLPPHDDRGSPFLAVEPPPDPPPVQAAPWLQLEAKVTAYSPHDAIDAEYHATKGERWRWITADGRTDVREVPYGVAAAQRALPFGARVRVPGYRQGRVIEVDDTGGGMRQSWRQGVLHIDVRFRTTASAGAWRTRTIVIEVDPESITPEQARALERFRVRPGADSRAP